MLKKTINFILTSVTVLFVTLLSINNAFAQGAGGAEPFGGLVMTQISCTCDEGKYWIFMNPMFISPVQMVGAMIYDSMGSMDKVYMHYSVPPSAQTWILGDYMSGKGQCRIRVAKYCITLPTFGTIDQIGTSMSGGV